LMYVSSDISSASSLDGEDFLLTEGGRNDCEWKRNAC
jgi:hypothetical protein